MLLHTQIVLPRPPTIHLWEAWPQKLMGVFYCTGWRLEMAGLDQDDLHDLIACNHNWH